MDRAASSGLVSRRRGALAGFVIAVTVVLTQATAGALTMSTPTNFPVGSNPLSLATGNFNGDTDPDLAVANYLSNNVSILIGNGAGGFTGPTSLAAGGRPASVAVGDFNRDTKLDLAVANLFTKNISILIGDGLGGFTGPTNFADGGSKPVSVAVGNFNGDTDPDLAVANNGANNVSILIGNGAGGFSAPINFAVGFAPASVAVGNFNGDASLDLAVANNASNNVSILVGNGTGGFTGPTNFAVGSSPYSVAVGNFNGDADPDLAVTNFSTNNVSVLLGGAGSTFTGPTNFPAGSGPYGIAVRDVDADTDADLTVGNIPGNRITLLTGNGLGGFAGPIGFSAPSGHHSVVVEDFNRDSAPDFAVTDAGINAVSILLQTEETVAAVGDVSKAEGDTGQTSFTFQVTLASSSTDQVSVNYHTEDGTATTADSDYTPLPVQTLTFAPGETSKTVTVNVTGDIDAEPDETFMLVLSDPVNASISDDTGTGTIQNDDQPGYPRPQAAATVEASLVPVFRKCNAPNLTHGPALAHPSCGPPVPLSQYLTVGTPDANGRPAKAEGSVRYEAMPGDPGTQADEADVLLDIDIADVRGSTTLGDYIAELWATVGVRLTDRPNVAPGTPATTADFQFSLAVPCASTPDATIGAACSITTTADAVLPGSVPEKGRSIWQLGQVQVQDGGEDGEGATTADNTLFMKQGIFVP
jgi:Calx-beta domain/FG-GAP-like repeat